MIAIVWRYAVKPEARAEFEAAYGPAGDWAALFARAGVEACAAEMGIEPQNG